MKKILAYATTDDTASLFDAIVAYDSGVDIVIPYTNCSEKVIEELVHNSVFTRHPKKLENTALLIGGKDDKEAEKLYSKACEVIDSLPEPFSISVACDPEGASTTSSACVKKIVEGMAGSVSGVNTLVLAGTGPVGKRVAALLAKEGANVKLSSRSLDKALEAAEEIRLSHRLSVDAIQVSGSDELSQAVDGVEVIASCGSEGVELVSKEALSGIISVRVLADINAVPPYGIACVKPSDDLVEDGGRILIGALGVGGLKMRIHKALVEELFKGNTGRFDLLSVYSLL